MGNFLDEYEPVEDRLRQFWTDHPFGRVITELIKHDDGDYIVQASVYFGNELRNDPATATGLAHDSVSSLPNNMKASALEVCETSAIGRALANCGYAAKGKRPSREEMQKVSANEAPVYGEGASGSEGGTTGPGSGATDDGEPLDRPDPAKVVTITTLEQLVDGYQTAAKAMLAARNLGFQVRNLGELTEGEAKVLLAQAPA